MTTPLDHLSQALDVLDEVLRHPDLRLPARLEIKLAELDILTITGPTAPSAAETESITGTDDGLHAAIAYLQTARAATDSSDVLIAAAEAERRLTALLTRSRPDTVP